MAHSHGCLYTRDAISNLGLAPYVVSHTSAAGVHHGTEIAGMTVKLKETESKMLKTAFMQCKSTREIARYLGISQPSVVRKLKKYGISRQSQ